METYKQEFIDFMVESDVLKKISIFHECRSLCDRFPVKETWRVLCKGNP